MLEQTLLSYIAEGWPLSEIVVVDNTGSSRQNLHGLLSSDNHTFLNYTRLLQHYGVSIYRLPSRQSFAQLQNFLLELAFESQWRDFYISHQDVVVRRRFNSTLSVYQHILADRTSTAPRALTWFHYDWLSRVNVHAAVEIGTWDILIPWYPADCDYYGRARLKGFPILDYYAGEFYDVASCLSDPEKMLFWPPNTTEYQRVDEALKEMALEKGRNGKRSNNGRNTWQGREEHGISDDFGPRFQRMVGASRANYRQKWGTRHRYFSG
ncbi:hypothetical protein PV10_06852 [Exophiala mesophila]|uniref:Uncharacterized protein n=1 Tax=Exophiala mesophila TaxID=212818 RepID=A0A0D1ZRR9_EXOME|nr:uncharacterized protein PV10_06852 [Exophiala mesophila]KIV89453.1 hypothetical protein PV10_06852 [Exophiala mesophila]